MEQKYMTDKKAIDLGIIHNLLNQYTNEINNIKFDNCSMNPEIDIGI